MKVSVDDRRRELYETASGVAKQDQLAGEAGGATLQGLAKDPAISDGVGCCG